MAAFLLTLLAAPLFAFPAAEAFDVEVISDISAPSMDEGRALEIKNERFWRPVLQSSDHSELEGHASLYREAEATIAALPAEHAFVREALRDALEHLRRADAAIMAQARRHAQLASEQLAAPAGGAWGGSFSLLTGGQNFLALALRRFADFGDYFSRLRDDIGERRAGVLPALRGGLAKADGVLKDCRVASSRSFDALKHDVYQRGAAKTPDAANAVADRIVEAAAETRSRFLKLMASPVDGVARDGEGQQDQPSATVTRALLEDMEPVSQDTTRGLQITI